MEELYGQLVRGEMHSKLTSFSPPYLQYLVKYLWSPVYEVRAYQDTYQDY